MALNKRTISRQNAFIVCFCKKSVDEDIEFFKKYCEEHLDIKLNEFSISLINKCSENIQELDNIISKNLLNWSINRISKCSSVILRLAICEILYFDDIPYKVSVNEYIEIAKLYTDQKDVSFINGVLASVIKEVESSNKI